MKRVIDAAKKIKANRLSSITCVKEAEGFALYYHFSNDKDPKLKELRIDVAADEQVESLMPLYPNAEIFESEATELFGVKFKGNPSSGKRLFLEER